MKIYNDDIDRILSEKINNIKSENKFTLDEIKNIIVSAKNKKRIRKYYVTIGFSFTFLFIILVISCLKSNFKIYNKFNNSYQFDLVANKIPKAEISTSNDNYVVLDKEKNIYKVTYVDDSYQEYVNIENITKLYIIRVDKITESLFINEKPVTKMKCTILNSLIGDEKSDNIEIIIEGALFSIKDLEPYKLKYNLDETFLEENKNEPLLVRLISEFADSKIEMPTEGSIYIVSLNENNEVIINCQYPFLYFSNNTYKTKDNQWKTVEF